MKYLYTLSDPSGIIFWVGITNSPKKRLKQHKNAVNYFNNSLLAEWVQRLYDENFEPEMEVIYKTEDNAEIRQLEKELTKEYWERGYPILNTEARINTFAERMERMNKFAIY